MSEGYKIVYEGGSGEIEEKKSRFIATVRPVGSEEEVTAFLAEMKKKYWDARHNCFAYVIGERMNWCAVRMTENRAEQRDARCWMCC